MRYNLKVDQYKVSVTLSANHPDDRAPIIYEGNSEAIALVQEVLPYQTGIHGHTISEVTSPADLYIAMRRSAMQQFSPSLVEGEDILDGYSASTPEGSCT